MNRHDVTKDPSYIATKDGIDTIKLQSISGVDTKVGFDVYISQKELQPNKEAQNEIVAFLNGSTMVQEQYNTNVTENDSDIEENGTNDQVDDFVFESTNHKYSTRKKQSAVITYSSSSEGFSDEEEYVDSSEESDNEEYDDKKKSKHYRILRICGSFSSKKNSTSPSVTVITPQCERKDIIAQAGCYAKCTITSYNYFVFEISADPIYEQCQ